MLCTPIPSPEKWEFLTMFTLKDSSQEANVEPGGQSNGYIFVNALVQDSHLNAIYTIPFYVDYQRLVAGVVLSQTVTDYPVPFPPGNCCINAHLCQRTNNYPLPWL